MTDRERIAVLEKEIQELRSRADWRQLDRKRILDAITIEAERLQQINDTCKDESQIRENAKCIAQLGLTFVEIVKAL